MTLCKTRPKGSITTAGEALLRYPLLVSHLICESLFYLDPKAAAAALASHAQGQPFPCEWYLDMAQDGRSLYEVGAGTIQQAYRYRNHHRGYMRSYPDARKMVEQERNRLLRQEAE